MLGRLFKTRTTKGDIASVLYGAIVAQARNPAIFRDLAVPDTVEGRFETIVAHLVLFLRRLDVEGEGARAVGQAAFDHFCDDMDRALREMGVGDTSVGKKMRRIGEAFYGRAEVYGAALRARNAGTLSEAVGRNVYHGGTAEVAAAGFAAYMLAAEQRLAEARLDAILAGALPWPSPADFLAKEARN
jgi:cytochrome b pre-mRNA-processing protein 3